MMKPKHNLQHKPEQEKDERKRKPDQPAQAQDLAQESAAPGTFAQVQHLLGNRAVERMVHHGSSSGSFSFKPGGPANIMRQALIDRALGDAGPVPTVQREGEEETDVGTEGAEELDTGGGSNGAVTINPVNPTTYTVSGVTLADVGAALGTDEWGRCTWNFTYTYETTGSRVTRVDLTLDLTINMPVWSDYSSASTAAKAEWDRMHAALQAHEDGHAALARQWAPTIRDNMVNKTAAQMRTAYNTQRGRHDQAQRDYDTTTAHGQNTGVSLDTSIP